MPENNAPNHPASVTPKASGNRSGPGPDVASHAWLAQLGDTEIIAVTGPDSERFLQGQLSCNMDRLSPAQSLRAALCNLKGRVVADMRVIRLEDCILLVCSAGMADIVLATLNKYKVFFKAELQKVTEEYTTLAIAGDDCAQALSASGLHPPETENACTFEQGAAIMRAQLSPARFYCVLSGTSGELAAALTSRCESGTEQDWRLADIVAGIAHIRPGQQELYTPQVLNYDIDGVIDFKKGCYTGQEVVARMFYRAEAKKRVRHIVLDTKDSLPDNRDIIDAVELSSGPTHALVIMPVTST